MNIIDKFRGCIIGGAIGDACGSAYENIEKKTNNLTYYPFGKPIKKKPRWNITDDTQLTIATCEVISENSEYMVETFADKYLSFYQKRKITGIGASTLQSFRGLEVGGHWSQVGRKGEFAAGNGAAMRIAPLAFEKNISNNLIKNICNITHQNDEAYIGALCVIISLRAIINKSWTGKQNLIELIISEIPDTKIRDRFIHINELNYDCEKISQLGNNGYVVNSIPLAIAYASKVQEFGIVKMYKELIKIGGDTDTNCSIAGQIAGCLIGYKKIPYELTMELEKLKDYRWIDQTIENYTYKKLIPLVNK